MYERGVNIQPVEQNLLIPLTQVLDHASPRLQEGNTVIDFSSSIQNSLDTLFPEQQYDKNVQKARDILGSTADEFTPEQLKDLVLEIQFLADSWLDDFERRLFNGSTLTELLHEKGGI